MPPVVSPGETPLGNVAPQKLSCLWVLRPSMDELSAGSKTWKKNKFRGGVFLDKTGMLGQYGKD